MRRLDEREMFLLPTASLVSILTFVFRFINVNQFPGETANDNDKCKKEVDDVRCAPRKFSP